MNKHYTFLMENNLFEASSAFDLGRIIGALKQSLQKLFGKNTAIADGIRDMAIRKCATGGWSLATFGPKSPLMRELQSFAESMKKLRDSGYTKKVAEAEGEILKLINNTSKSVTESSESLAGRIRELVEKLTADAAREGNVTSKTLQKGLDSANAKYADAIKTFVSNGRQAAKVSGEATKIADDAVKGISDKLSVSSIQNTIRKLRAQRAAATDPNEVRMLISKIEAAKAKLARAKSMQKLSATTAFGPGNVNAAVDNGASTIQQAVQPYADAAEQAARHINMRRGLESMEQPRSLWDRVVGIFRR